MNQITKPEAKAASHDWLEAELADTLDEDYELELSEPALSEELRKIYKRTHPPTIERRQYFHHLLKLQAELIKLQDWVVHSRSKVLVLFEGRDSAGKGGAIKIRKLRCLSASSIRIMKEKPFRPSSMCRRNIDAS